MYYIYALINPINNLPFYVGLTQNPEYRIIQHISQVFNNTPKEVFIKLLLDNGVIPEMDILFEIPTEREAFEREIATIMEYGMKYTILNTKHTAYTGKSKFPSSRSGCGEHGFLCGHIYECDLCMEVELAKRKERISIMMQNHQGELLMTFISNDRWATVGKELSRQGISYISVMQDECIRLLICEKNPYKRKDIGLSPITKKEAEDELSKMKNLFPSVGIRSTGGGWRLTD